MDRQLSESLRAWLDDSDRRALVLRGARQVGKTWLVRDLAAQSGRDLIEINFERDPDRAALFSHGDPRRVVDDLGLALDREIDPQRSLLFLDEIQAAPEVLGSLRWFTEEMPDLSVIAAGSLLEFALSDTSVRLPVGRVSYRHVEPMSFAEYLTAHGQDRLIERLSSWHPGDELSAVVHERAASFYERFGMVGGMPAVVANDVEHAAPQRCRRLQTDLVAAYRDDFAKYVGRMDPTILDSVLMAVAYQLGGKFVYARVGNGVKQHQVRNALELLARARLVTLVPHSTATGIPLGGEVNARNRKAVLLDVGLAHALLGTPAGRTFPAWPRLAAQVRARLSEQLAAQQLRALDPGSGSEAVLHYWQRGGGRPGEVDFLVQVGHHVVPVELKSGAAGSMKSLHQFAHDRGVDLALRIDTNPPSLQALDVKTTRGDMVHYRLLSLPGYMLWRCADLLSTVKDSCG